MILASAYPNSALSALTMMAIGLVVASTLALWIGLVFLADRQPRKPRAGQGRAGDDIALYHGTDNEHGSAGHRLARKSRAA